MKHIETGVADFDLNSVLVEYEELRIQLRVRQDSSDGAAIANSRVVAEVSPVLETHDAAIKKFLLAVDNRSQMERVVGNATIRRWESDVMAFTPAIQDELTRVQPRGRYVECVPRRFAGLSPERPVLILRKRGKTRKRVLVTAHRRSHFAEQLKVLIR